jgi:protein-disulfide isomerase
MRFLFTIGLLVLGTFSISLPLGVARVDAATNAAPQLCASPSGSSDSTAVLARVGNQQITLADLVQGQHLFQADYQFYLAEVDALNQAIDKQLLEQEARKEKVTVDQLLQRHVTNRLNISEENLHFYYSLLAASRKATPPYSQLREDIRKSVTDILERHMKEAYLQTLRDEYHVRVLLQPPQAEFALKDARSTGPTDAPVTVVEFADFECPYCRQVEPNLEKLRENYAGKVRFVYEDFPLPMHSHAEKAAEAARCAAAQGKFWPYHDRLFAADQKGLDVPDLKAAAASVGLDTNSFNKCLDSGEQAAAIQSDMDQGKRLGVSATPTFFINGHLVAGAMSYEAMRDLVDQELAAKAGAGKPASTSESQASANSVTAATK